MEQTTVLSFLTYGIVLILSAHLGYSKSIPKKKPSDIPISILVIYFAITFSIWCFVWDFKNHQKGINYFLALAPFFIVMIVDTIHQLSIDLKKETI